MGSPCAREGDSVLTSCICTPVTTMLAGDQTGNGANVFANGMGITCVDDPVTPHATLNVVCVPCPFPVAVGSSGTVKVGGKLVSRMGDVADLTLAPGVISSGSPNVIVG